MAEAAVLGDPKKNEPMPDIAVHEISPPLPESTHMQTIGQLFQRITETENPFLGLEPVKPLISPKNPFWPLPEAARISPGPFFDNQRSPETIFGNILESNPFECKPRSIFDLGCQTIPEPSERLQSRSNLSGGWINAGSTETPPDQSRYDIDSDSSDRDRFADSDPGTTYHESEGTPYSNSDDTQD